jgi:hypothetical protein
LVLAGLTAGCAAWTKNEGQLFVAAVVAARLAAVVPRQGWKVFARQMVLFGLGLLPVALTLLYFKTHHAAPGDLVSGQDRGAILDRLVDLSRYRLIGRYVADIIPPKAGLPLVVLCLYFFFAGMADRRQARVSVLPVILVVVLMPAGYLAVFVIMSQDLDLYLSTTVDRLLLQLWPLVLLSFFLCAATPEEALAGQAPPATDKRGD